MDDRCIIVDRCPEVPLEEFLPDVIIHAKGAPADMVAHYIRRSAIEFLRCTKVLRQMICVDLQACVCDYILEPDCDMEIISIHKICECRELIPYRACEGANDCDGPSAWFVPPQTLTLSPAPQRDIEDGLSVLVSVAPKKDACFVHRELCDRHYDAIVAGALKRLLMIKNTEFYDLQLAKEFRKEFDKEATVAAVDRLLGYGMGPVKMHPRSRRYA